MKKPPLRWWLFDNTDMVSTERCLWCSCYTKTTMDAIMV